MDTMQRYNRQANESMAHFRMRVFFGTIRRLWNTKVRKRGCATISAVVTRADGRVENYGVVSETFSNRFRATTD